MKKTTDNQPWRLALPSEFTAETVSSHLKGLAISSESEPELCEIHLESMRVHLKQATETRHSEVRAAVCDASQLPNPERIKARDKIRQKLDEGRAEDSLAMISLRIVEAAVLAGKARLLLEPLEKEAYEKEAEIFSITEEMIKIQSPIKNNGAVIETLMKERLRIEAIGSDLSTLSISDFDDRLKDCAARGEFNGDPNEKGYFKMLREIDSEIETLKSEQDEAGLEPGAMGLSLGDLKDRRDPIEARLRKLKHEMVSAEKIKTDAVECMKSTLATCQAEALAIVLALDLEREVRNLGESE